MCFQQIVDIFQGLLTPVIGIVTVYIAYQQWRTNHQKLNLERYDRRLRIYEEVKKILSLISRDAKADYNNLLKFRVSVSEADFLFGLEIPQYTKRFLSMDAIWRVGLRNIVITHKFSPLPKIITIKKYVMKCIRSCFG